jgi:hypothetical protein
MRYSILFVLLLTGLNSCDNGTDTSVEGGTGSTQTKAFPVTGNIYATRDCETIVSLAGFTVSIEGTGLTAVTNDSGIYTFPAVPPGRYYTKISKETYWPKTSELEVYPNGKVNLPYPYIDGKSSLEARFVGDWFMETAQTQVVTDSFYTNSHGERVRTWVYRTVLDTVFKIAAEPLDGGVITNNAAVTAWMQRTPDFDYFDNAKYLAGSSGPNMQFSVYQLRTSGVKSGETVYARVWAHNQCMNGSGGYRISGTSGLKSLVIP